MLMSNICALPAGPTPTILVTLMPMAFSNMGASWLSLSYAQAMLARFCREQENLPMGRSQHVWWQTHDISGGPQQQCSYATAAQSRQRQVEYAEGDDGAKRPHHPQA